MSEKKSWFGRLKSGLSKSTEKITSGITEAVTNVVAKKKLDQATLDDLEDALIVADLGLDASAEIIQNLSKNRFGKDVSEDEIKESLSDSITKILNPVAKPFELFGHKPEVVLVIGVNGTGKTTTIGKLAAQLRDEGKSVLLAAGDTFRAAAIEQLSIWADRTGATIYKKEHGADAAALAYEAVDKAKKENIDVVLIDTAGRLHNQANLMAELAKIIRVLEKHNIDAPHHTLMTLDATTGQNAHQQIELFKETAPITGLIITKLDGTAKGGVVVSLAKSFELPIHAVGVGETMDDLNPFNAKDFATSLVGMKS